MDYMVMRLYEGGCRMQKHVRLACAVRGTFRISEETIGRRRLLVARVIERQAGRPIPPLHEVVLVGTSGSAWVLSGHERLEAGPMRKETLLGQVWLVEPCAMEDVIAIEQKWLAATREVSDLRLQLTAMLPPTPQPAAAP